MREAVNDYLEVNGANRSSISGEEAILAHRKIAANRLAIDCIYVLFKGLKSHHGVRGFHLLRLHHKDSLRKRIVLERYPQHQISRILQVADFRFIIGKQKEEMKRLDATRQYRKHQMEMANQKILEAESITSALIEKANERERQSEDLDRAISGKRFRQNKEKGSELLNAAVGWATGKSKALKNKIEDLRCEISSHEETIGRL